MPDRVKLALTRETETLQVWEVVVHPGESFAGEDHRVGYVVIVMEGDLISVEDSDGQVQEMTVSPGEVLVGGPSPRHKVTNAGSVPYREIVVELKER